MKQRPIYTLAYLHDFLIVLCSDKETQVGCKKRSEKQNHCRVWSLF